jgi:ATP-dependent protease ClpP protease subunit
MEFLAERSLKPVKWWEDVCEKGDYYITPAEALKIGLVDEVY